MIRCGAGYDPWSYQEWPRIVLASRGFRLQSGPSKRHPNGDVRMMRFWKAMLATVALCVATVAQAQDAYPSRPVRIVVPAAPGGSFDALARIVAQALSE